MYTILVFPTCVGMNRPRILLAHHTQRIPHVGNRIPSAHTILIISRSSISNCLSDKMGSKLHKFRAVAVP